MQRALLCYVAAVSFVLLLAGCTDTPPATDPLKANAGADQNVDADAEVTLTATASGGTPPYVYRWSIQTQPSGEDVDLEDINTNAALTVGPLLTEGDYRFRVRVTDTAGATATSFVNVAVGGKLAITAEAADPIVVVGDETDLTVTFDSGTSGFENITYTWQVVEGAGELSDTDVDDPTVTINAAETVQLRVTVRADDEDTGDEVIGIKEVFVVGVNDRTPQVIIQNSGGVQGRIVLELFSRSAPITVANFLRYVDDGYYTGLVWHRVPPNDFVIQTGAFERNDDGVLEEREGERAAIASEASNGRSNLRGTISMALRGEDAASGTNQFFINIGDNTGLDSGPPAFTVFGRVVEGLEEVADEIASVDTGTETVEGSEFDDVPEVDIILSSVTRATTEVPTDGDEDDDDPDAEEIEIEATAADPVVIQGETTTLDVTYDADEVPGTPTFTWRVVSGDAELSNTKVENPVLTVNTNGTVEVAVVLRASDDNDAVRGEASVFLVGVASANPQVVLDVRSASGGPFSIAGEVIIELLPDDAPNTVANFLRYVDADFYENVVFHRVLAGKLVQSGGYTRSGDTLVEKTGTHDPVDSEADNGLEHLRASVALALLGSDANSGTSQFFINVDDNADLDSADPPFTIFGRVISGMDVIDEIAALETDRDASGLTNVPVEDIIIASAERRDDIETIDVTATSDDPLVLLSESTTVRAVFEDDDLPGTASVRWTIVEGDASLSTLTSPTPTLTVNTNGTIHLRVRVTAEDDETSAEGEAEVYVVGIPDALPTVVIRNSGAVTGDITLELLSEAAPNTVANFLRYVDDGYYEDIVWHRVDGDFVIQAGGYKRVNGALVAQDTREPVTSEANNGFSNTEGHVAMALRGTDANSGTTQFFINLGDNSSLDDGSPPFTVFARVIDGEEVVDAIAALPITSDSGQNEVPEEDVVFTIERGE